MTLEGLYAAPHSYSPAYPFRLSALLETPTDEAFFPRLKPTSETLMGVPRNDGTRPVGLNERGLGEAANTIDFTYSKRSGATRTSAAGVDSGSNDSSVFDRLPSA